MNPLMKNKKLILILLTLLAGVLIGWMLKPSSHHHTNTSASHDHTGEKAWTCSMHPQIRQKEPGKCPICGMDLIEVSSRRSTTTNPMRHEMTPEAVALANISTSRVTGVSSDGELFLTGKVKADERKNASITAKFPGRIEKLYVNFTGQTVRQGERLASIYSPELVTAQRELLEARASRESFPELYTAARQKLKQWKLSEKQIEGIEASGKVSEQFDVLADNGGVVTQLNVSVGDYVNTGSALFTVSDLSHVWILLDAYETDLPLIKTGNEVSFTVAGVPGETLSAKISYVDPVINPDTRAASVRAEIANQQTKLKPEMFVNAKIKTSSRTTSSLAIPRTALLWSGKRSIVYVKVPDAEYPTYEMREVTIGGRAGDMYVVESGLEAGEEIVTNGVFAVDASAQLAGNYSMMMRPERKSIEVPDKFRQQITVVADAYFKVKNALVNDDINQAKTAAENLIKSISAVDMTLLKGPAHERWMNILTPLMSHTRTMQHAKNIEDMRTQFSGVSEMIIEMTETFGLLKPEVYKEYCPMAFNNKGGYWLSETDEILNPYFGASMLHCGEITETYREGEAVFEKESSSKSSQTHNH